MKKEIVKYGLGALAVLAAVAVLIAVAVKIRNAVRDAAANARLSNEANAEIDTAQRTISDTQLNTLVSKLKAAFYSGLWGWTEDEAAIYAAFEQVNSRSDVLMLEREFGVYKGKTLKEHIATLLDEDEIDHINSIFASKSVNYRY